MISPDPLSGHADPRLYVPLDSGERALAEISAHLKQGQSPILLTGPSGVGKTILLRVLAEREWKSFPRVRFTPLLSLGPEDLSDWLLHLLFRKPSGGSPEAEDALLEELRSLRNDPILLLVDNIQRTPAASIRKLGELAFAGRPGLAVIVAGTDDRSRNALARAFAPAAAVELPDLLPDTDIETLYEAIVAHPGLSPRLRHRLTGVARDEITRAAAGIPRLLKSELVRRNEPRTAAQRGFLPVETPRLTIVREPASAVETAKPAEPQPVPRRRRLAGRVAVIGRASGVFLALLILTCAFVAGVPPTLAAALSHSAHDALRSGADVVASAWRGALRVASVAAVPATALVALALFSLGNYGIGMRPSLTAAAAALALSDVATPTSPLLPVAESPGILARTQPVNVQVNARPWARVRINGIDVGPTPLSQRLAPGVYQLEAEFPSGERIQREIDVGPKNRFVALP
jgi:predicted ABC-type transport system involved in lysophospholipase L1 biosynthesis ATPase subunit